LIEAAYQKYLKLTGEPAAAATLVLAEVIGGKPEEGDMLTVKQAAKRLGVGTNKVYQMCDDGQLKHTRVGNRVRIKPEDLDTSGQLSKTDRLTAVRSAHFA